jgi:hypothetical protein
VARMGESGNPHTILVAKSFEEQPYGRWEMRLDGNVKIPIKIFVPRMELVQRRIKCALLNSSFANMVLVMFTSFY